MLPLPSRHPPTQAFNHPSQASYNLPLQQLPKKLSSIPHFLLPTPPPSATIAASPHRSKQTMPSTPLPLPHAPAQSGSAEVRVSREGGLSSTSSTSGKGVDDAGASEASPVADEAPVVSRKEEEEEGMPTTRRSLAAAAAAAHPVPSAQPSLSVAASGSPESAPASAATGTDLLPKAASVAPAAAALASSSGAGGGSASLPQSIDAAKAGAPATGPGAGPPQHPLAQLTPQVVANFLQNQQIRRAFDAQSFMRSYEQLYRWVDRSMDMYKVRLSAVCYLFALFHILAFSKNCISLFL